MTARAFRFGVMTSGKFSAGEWRAFVQQVDELGYDVLNMPNHRATPGLSPLIAMAWAAQVSQRLRFGTLVLDNESVDPGVIAKDTATLDVLSEGRLDVGIGAGWLPADHASIGQPWRTAGERIERLAEAIAVLKACWTETSVTRPSAHFPLDGARNEPLVLQQPHPPLLVGGGGERVLRLAAAEADIVSFVPNMAAGRLGPESAADGRGDAMLRKLEWVRDAAGSRFGHLELHTNLTQVIVTEDLDAGLAKVKRGYALERDVDALAVPHAVVGTHDQIADQLLARRELLGISYYSVFEPGMLSFAPVIERLRGL